MKYKSVKSAKEIKLSGEITIVVDTRDGSARAITLTDGSGNVLRAEGDYGLQVLIKEPPKMGTKFRLSGKVDDLTIEPQLFDDKHEAERARGINESLTIEEVEVEITD